MGINVTAVRIADASARASVEPQLAAVAVPEGEIWTAALVEDPEGAWDLSVVGPSRLPSAAWTATATDQPGGTRYRSRLEPAEASASRVVESVHELAWGWIRVRSNPLTDHDPVLAQAYEKAVRDVLLRGRPEPVEIAFNVWREDPSRPQVVCKVERLQGSAGLPPWRWWSALASAPAELAGQLRQVLEGPVPVPVGTPASRRRGRTAWVAPRAS